MKIAFLGLGSMGSPIAQNLLKAGHNLTIFNRTRQRAETLAQYGAKVAESASEAVTGAEIAITMLADDSAVEAVVLRDTRLLNSLPHEAIHISMSTISVALAERLTQAHTERGQGFISSPVFGRPEAAEQQKLFVVTAGPQQLLQKCEPIFCAIGQKTFSVGEKPIFANVVKLGGNFLIAATIEAFAEAITLARKYGLDPGTYFGVLQDSLFGSPIVKTYGSRIANDNYEPVGFRLPLGLKDVRLTLAAAEAASVPMPFANIIRDHMLEAMARGMENADWSAFARIAAENAGLKESRRP